MFSRLKEARVLITGGCGFIGSHLVCRLIAEGARLWVPTRDSQSCWRLENVSTSTRILELSLTNDEELKKAIKEIQPQFVFNLAGSIKREQDLTLLERELYPTNVRIPYRLLGVLRDEPALQKFIQVGSIAECTGCEAPFREDVSEIPLTPYGLSKLMATKMLTYAARVLRFPVVVLRPSVVYGPGQVAGMLIPNFIRSCLEKKDFPFSAGEQTRDFVYVEDVVDALIKAAEHDGLTGETFHIGSGEERTVKDVVEKINSLMGNPITIRYGEVPYGPGETMRFSVDIRKARTLLGWEPKTDFATGLEATIEWYSTCYEKNPSLVARFFRANHLD